MEKNNRSKYTIVLRLGHSTSLRAMPPYKTTAETIKVLSDVYVERMGTAILYRPPKIFGIFLKTFSSLVDAKQMSKVIWITGSVDDGSKNDILMKSILGDSWKEIVGEGMPQQDEKSCPGFVYDTYEKQILELEANGL